MRTYGDLSYLLKANYEEAMRSLIVQAKAIGVNEIRLYDSDDASGATISNKDVMRSKDDLHKKGGQARTLRLGWTCPS